MQGRNETLNAIVKGLPIPRPGVPESFKVLMRAYLLIVGEKEKESRTLAIRSREGEDLGNMSLAQVIELLSEGIARLGRNVAKTE
jgi:hypothetical protein